MSEHRGGDAGLPPIRGNNVGIVNERDRLKDLGNQLEHTGRMIGGVRADGWAGRARNHFDEAQYELGKNWERAAESHLTAARALTYYQETLEELQRLAFSARADASTDPHEVEATKASLERWRAQLTVAGREAAAAIRRASAALLSLERLPSESAAPAPPEPVQREVVIPPQPEPQHVATLPFVPVAPHHPAYAEQVHTVNRAVFDAMCNS